MKHCYTLVMLILLAGCGSLGTTNMSGMLEVDNADPNACMIFKGTGRYDGRISESHIEGSVYVRRGTCNAIDQAEAQ